MSILEERNQIKVWGFPVPFIRKVNQNFPITKIRPRQPDIAKKNPAEKFPYSPEIL